MSATLKTIFVIGAILFAIYMVSSELETIGKELVKLTTKVEIVNSDIIDSFQNERLKWIEALKDEVPADAMGWLDILLDYCRIYAVDCRQVLAVIGCESNFVEDAVGDNGDSFGPAQFQEPTWNEFAQRYGLTRLDIKDPRDQMLMMVRMFADGYANRWTCWRNIYGEEKVKGIEIGDKGIEIFNKINELRVERNLKPLRLDERLVNAAQKHAEEIKRMGYFTHTNPEGKEFQIWLEDEGYKCKKNGENLARILTDPDEIVKAWVSSPTHLQVIERDYYIKTGIGTSGDIVVQMFGACE